MTRSIRCWKHESAIVDEGATIGEGTKIWHFSHVCSGAVIGNACSQRVKKLIREWAKMHEAELLQNWELARNEEKLVNIEPLE